MINCEVSAEPASGHNHKDGLTKDGTETGISTKNTESPNRRKPYFNPAARHWVSQPAPADEISTFHQKFALYSPTALISLPKIAKEIGVKEVYVKDESERCGLPSFKILGASWAACRAISSYINLPTRSDFNELAMPAQEAGIVLVAATDGNHGRALARVARLFRLKSSILVPSDLDTNTVQLIRDEGADVTVTDVDYDGTVMLAKSLAENIKSGILVQDTAFDGYEEIPQWIVDGYSTMMTEIESQLQGQHPDLIVTPVGVGSFAQAVVTHSKVAGRGTRVLSVEADTAACLWSSLSSGAPVQIETSSTIMSGMNCGTVSTIAWPVLRSGIDMSLTVSDYESHEAVQELVSMGVNAGPCGASTLAALRRVTGEDTSSLGLTKDSVVVLLSTEGTREYIAPLAVKIQDPVVGASQS